MTNVDVLADRAKERAMPKTKTARKLAVVEESLAKGADMRERPVDENKKCTLL